MIISSGYRNALVNHLVGDAVDKYGNAISQHCRGQAADFVVNGMTVQQIIDVIKNQILNMTNL